MAATDIRWAITFERVAGEDWRRKGEPVIEEVISIASRAPHHGEPVITSKANATGRYRVYRVGDDVAIGMVRDADGNFAWPESAAPPAHTLPRQAGLASGTRKRNARRVAA